jgi:hypothetical protein
VRSCRHDHHAATMALINLLLPGRNPTAKIHDAAVRSNRRCRHGPRSPVMDIGLADSLSRREYLGVLRPAPVRPGPHG